MRARDFRLAPMGPRRFAAILGAMLAVCVVVAVGMRLSLTGVNAGEPALDDVDYRVSPGSEGMIGLYTSGDVMAQLDAEGLTLDDITLEEARQRYVMAFDNVEQIAPVIAVGTFTGERSYVYHAFRERVIITSVIRGEALAAGDVIDVMEGYLVKEDGLASTGDNAQFGADRIIAESEGGSGAGLAPMREGQEYLLFLEPKRYPAGWEVAVPRATYCLVSHPYARIATDTGGATDRIAVVNMDELPTDQVGQATVVRMPRLPLRNAVEKDVYVQTERAKLVYLLTAEGILDRVLR